MTASDKQPLGGRPLRCVLTVTLVRTGRPMLLDELVRNVEADGHRIAGRASKTVSDALRWEIGRGRVERLGRGRYVAGRIPGSTYRWMRAIADRQRVAIHAPGSSSDLDAIVEEARLALVARQLELDAEARAAAPST